MSPSDGRRPVSPKNNLLTGRASLAPLCPASNELQPTSESKSFSESLTRSASPSPTSSFSQTMIAWMISSLLPAWIAEMKSSSMREPSSRQSTKQQGGKSNDIAEPADPLWAVKLHTKVGKTIAAHGGEDSDKFRPTIGELIDKLEKNPKQFPKKKGSLKKARSADVTFSDGIVWRAVFVLDEATRVVKVLALGPHDDAYADAKQRI